MVAWSVGWLVQWLVDWFCSRLNGWSVGWAIGVARQGSVYRLWVLLCVSVIGGMVYCFFWQARRPIGRCQHSSLVAPVAAAVIGVVVVVVDAAAVRCSWLDTIIRVSSHCFRRCCTLYTYLELCRKVEAVSLHGGAGTQQIVKVAEGKRQGESVQMARLKSPPASLSPCPPTMLSRASGKAGPSFLERLEVLPYRPSVPRLGLHTLAGVKRFRYEGE